MFSPSHSRRTLMSRNHEDGMSLFASPTNGTALSESEQLERSALHRVEYFELLRNVVVPKVLDLASLLVPTVRSGMEQKPRARTATADSFELLTSPFSVFGSGFRLPKTVALAVLDNVDDLVRSDDDDAVSLGALASSLPPEMSLMDIEADVLMDSIRSQTALLPLDNTSVSDPHEEDDMRSLSTFGGECDDDDMRGEIRRLGSVIASLQSDLAGVTFDEYHQSINATSFEDDVSTANDGPFSQESKELANGLKSWRVFGRQFDDSMSSSLYWALALTLSVVILVGGRSVLGLSLHNEFQHDFLDLKEFLSWVALRLG